MALDTLEIAKQLQEADFSKREAEGIAGVIGQVLEDLVTREYLQERLRTVEANITTNIESKIERELGLVHREIGQTAATLTHRFALLVLAQAGLVAALVKLL